ncbi:MAG: WD40 repeat domain-containing protein [bacterium]|nr:WD40 repeat domain-containing protein [bacterium]
MKILKFIVFFPLFGLTFFFISHFLGIPEAAFAEIKQPGFETTVGIIPKLPKTSNDPILSNGHVYPNWGPPCQRYTYSTIYSDKEGRAPEYMKIYFNGKMIDMTKTNSNDSDYKKGVQYEYKFVPNKLGSNFYYFEASNGKGKIRDSIIDSPDNGPVLFESAFDKNEIALIDSSSGKKVLSYPTGKEWVGGVALSGDGKYLAVKTSFKIYLFDVDNPQKPKWVYEYIKGGGMVGGDIKGGVDISGDGSKIIASIGQSVLLFDKSSNKPLWKNDQVGNAYNVAISRDGKYAAAATAGEESNLNSNLMILWDVSKEKPLWQYHSDSNFHDVSLSDDGKFIAGATGCPDRRAYIFSRDSNKPIIRSEQLTYDSPIAKSKISSDGSLAAFTTEGGPDSSVVLLFSKDSTKPLWKFEDGKQRAARGLGFSSDGKKIGVVTMAGDVYLLGKEKNTPIDKWSLGKAMGTLAIADDGSFLAVGGVDNKVRILKKGSKDIKEIVFNEYLQELDISANGKYIAAGTGGAIYFFEAFADENKVFECKNVVEPPPDSQSAGNSGGVDQGSPEAAAGNRDKGSSLLEIIINFIRNIFKPKSESTTLPGGQQQNNAGSSEKAAPSGKAVCGNNLCEPGLGETKQNCPQDCSGGN